MTIIHGILCCYHYYHHNICNSSRLLVINIIENTHTVPRSFLYDSPFSDVTLCNSAFLLSRLSVLTCPCAIPSSFLLDFPFSHVTYLRSFEAKSPVITWKPVSVEGKDWTGWRKRGSESRLGSLDIVGTLHLAVLTDRCRAVLRLFVWVLVSCFVLVFEICAFVISSVFRARWLRIYRPRERFISREVFFISLRRWFSGCTRVLCRGTSVMRCSINSTFDLKGIFAYTAAM